MDQLNESNIAGSPFSRRAVIAGIIGAGLAATAVGSMPPPAHAEPVGPTWGSGDTERWLLGTMPQSDAKSAGLFDVVSGMI